MQKNTEQASSFDRLIRGLIAVPKDELDAEIQKQEREKKIKDKKPKAKK